MNKKHGRASRLPADKRAGPRRYRPSAASRFLPRREARLPGIVTARGEAGAPRKNSIRPGENAAAAGSVRVPKEPQPALPASTPPPDLALFQARQESAVLLKRLEDIRRERQRMLSSTSWRITAPLRSAASAARRVRYWAGKLANWATTPRLWPHRYRQVRHLLEDRIEQGRRLRVGRSARGVFGSAGAADELERLDATMIRLRRLAVPPVIIVPVYNAPEETERCILSVLRHTDPAVRLILIDDASPDGRVTEVLARYAGIASVTVIRNRINLGFTRTINRGIELAGAADVVLLNSDTEVTPLWLRNLQLAAYCADRVASATPFSDNAGAFSAPEANKPNALPDEVGFDAYARLVTRASGRLYPQVPTGNGFCLYLRRDCIDEIGILDAEAFPRGYGEENDLCMRAGRAGWSHVIDDATLIHHVRSASFGEERTPLMQQGRDIVDARFPDYTAKVRAFLSDPVTASARRNVAAAFHAASRPPSPKPRVLFVIATKTGGTPQTNEDLMSALGDRYETFLLRCDSETIEFSRVVGRDQQRLETIRLATPLRAFPHQSEEYDRITQWLLVAYSIELVHIRHIAWHSLGLPNTAKQLGLPVVFSFHDYYTLCPTVKLLDENLKFCAGRCTPTFGECAHELWIDPHFPPLKHNAIHVWQARMSEMLSRCDAFVTTSPFVRDLLVDLFPHTGEKPFPVIEHGRDLALAMMPMAAPGANEKARILVPGNIGVPKGSLILRELARLNRPRAFELHLLGNTSIAESEGLVFHGPYNRERFRDKVEAIKPRFGMILSIWPETYCHTLTELWACGIPVIALDFGAVGERIRRHGGGWLLASAEPSLVRRQIEIIIGDARDYEAKRDEVAAWQAGPGRRDTIENMANGYSALYRDVIERRINPAPASADYPALH